MQAYLMSAYCNTGKFCYPILRKVSYFSAKFLQQFEMQEVGECQQQMIYICISQHLYLAN